MKQQKKQRKIWAIVSNDDSEFMWFQNKEVKVPFVFPSKKKKDAFVRACKDNQFTARRLREHGAKLVEYREVDSKFL